MTQRYIEVNSELFESWLQEKGFIRNDSVSGNEVVYEICNCKNPNVRVRVYTSIARGKESARKIGKDSIKVSCFFDDGKTSFGIAKMPRIYRTGSQAKVQERTLSRMREAYSLGNRWIRMHKAVI